MGSGRFRLVGAVCSVWTALWAVCGVRAAWGGQDDWSPPFYAYCVDMPRVQDPPVAEQAKLLARLGFDGVGYPLWLDERLERNLRILDDAGLKVYMLYTPVNVNPDSPPYDQRLPAAIRKLRGRPVTVCVVLRGFPPQDPRGLEPAVHILRRLGDVAAAAGLRISIYHHTGDWAASFIHALEVVEKVNHPQVGVNFNLCHWLKVDGDKDYRPWVEKHAHRIFVVAINGATVGATTWTDGLIQPLDRGDFDNRRLLQTLRQADYRGPIGLMCYGVPEPSREHLERSMKVWRSWQAEWSGARDAGQ
ncbi:MAG TPA: sugar phosphate isomerase/epimerase [Planctomycetaceae bacterium]|nr:sugar phosphate isomerase/epimerase [Planctomycetaceae bacterium]HIQ23122.1 sugar phosphate isomerase/epimerase [Planctomycetota bacterium]